MEIHKPKPFHDWREFLSEVLIIILGVSIALAAEQAIEALHWHHKIETIEDAMRAELLEDDLPQAYTRAVINHCLVAQLDALQAAARPGANGTRFAALAADYYPPYRTWDMFALATGQQSDLSTHMSSERLGAWSLAYSVVPGMGRVQEAEKDALRLLHRSHFRGRKLSQADADQINDAIDDLRTYNVSMTAGGRVMLVNAQRAVGIALSDHQRKTVIEESRRVYGDCVVAPTNEMPSSDRQVFTREERQKAVGS